MRRARGRAKHEFHSAGRRYLNGPRLARSIGVTVARHRRSSKDGEEYVGALVLPASTASFEHARRRSLQDHELGGEGLQSAHGVHEAFAEKLTASGELAGGEGLAAPDQAKLVRAGKSSRSCSSPMCVAMRVLVRTAS